MLRTIELTNLNVSYMTTGDIVQLRSGGPKMTIQRVIGTDKSNFGLKAADEYLKMRGFTDGDVICQWFEGNTLRDGTFKSASLTLENAAENVMEG